MIGWLRRRRRTAAAVDEQPKLLRTLAEVEAYDRAGPNLVDWDGTGDPSKLPPPPKPPHWPPATADGLGRGVDG